VERRAVRAGPPSTPRCGNSGSKRLLGSPRRRKNRLGSPDLSKNCAVRIRTRRTPRLGWRFPGFARTSPKRR
jgi:hypothetical protein